MRIEEVVGRNLEQLRTARGWSQARFGEEVGSHYGKAWSRATVSAAESGARAFTVADMVLICLIFEVALERLVVLPSEAQAVAVGPATYQRADLAPIGWSAAPTKRTYDDVLRQMDRLHHELEEILDVATTAQDRGRAIRVTLLRLGNVEALKALGVARGEDAWFENERNEEP
ncbi:helix-turn-helix transcriptional regulator [Cellulomonas sp. ATA003]|uniref:helix-turn-helix transcriptional regulator n=1 Tax=Cellulomonas sp. ATA003 TaxID=3073064 RepID=UPI002873E203|nr:helix-turn-helix transcriptional regulator [Cellulomonas sp. ATA003]WNB84521.1 helix-turn-helix transcriptional regulator [Cellulomonas sp. ATA003]